ncbi:MAG: hypothetical protein GON13_03325 [Nanoarchaeota archaeon]|nr:hypothetical protein [Nanoarchaeota archaeon]
MRFSEAVKYYSNKKVQEQIVLTSKNREVIPMFANKGFGKRPSTIMYEREVYDLARKGATSFHASEEKWINPLMLEKTTSQRRLDEIRKGWDLILDIDTDNFEHAKKTTGVIIEAFKSHGIKNVSLKFSGNKGFHIGIPFESFPTHFSGQPVKELFPEAPRIIAEYLKKFTEKHLTKKIGSKPFEKVIIDTVFLSSRHLFRMPYSLHEKSGLVSLPINIEELEKFTKEQAKPEKIEIRTFLQKNAKEEAKELLTQAYNWNYELEKDETVKSNKEFITPKIAAPEEIFPPCVKKLLDGVEDGRKRTVFVLINFLRSVGWSEEMVEEKLYAWNEKNYEPLKKGYIKSQLNWHKRLKTTYSPPNCDNKVYYEDLGIKCSEQICSKIKNPAVYTLIRMKKWKKKLTTK